MSNKHFGGFLIFLIVGLFAIFISIIAMIGTHRATIDSLERQLDACVSRETSFFLDPGQ